MITMVFLDWILLKASVDSIRKGKEYFRQRKVQEILKDADILYGKVAGTKIYNYEIDLKKKEASCDCPAPYPCEHLVAVALQYSVFSDQIKTISRKEKIIPKITNYAVAYQILDEDQLSLKKVNPDTGKLESILPRDILYLTNGQSAHVFQFGIFRQEDLDNAPVNDMFSYTLQNGLVRYFSKDEKEIFFGGNLKVFFELKKVESLKDKFQISAFYYDPVSNEKTILQPYEHYFRGDLLKLHLPSDSTDSKEKKLFYAVYLDNLSRPPFSFSHAGQRLFNADTILTNSKWLKRFKVENLQKFEEEIFRSGPIASISIFPDTSGKEIKIKGKLEFLYAKKKELLKDIDHSNVLDPSKEIFLTRFPLKAIVTRARWKYSTDDLDNITERDLVQERQLVAIFKELKLPLKGKEFTIAVASIPDFIGIHIPKMRKAGIKINIHKDLILLFDNSRIVRSIFDFDASPSGIDWFDGKIKIDGLSAKEFRLALQAYKKKEKLFRLHDGSWVSLENLGLRKLIESFENLGIKVHNDGSVKNLNRGQIVSVEMEMDTRTDSGIKNLTEKIKALPYRRKAATGKFQTGFQGKLRDYQKEGVLFLESLYEIGMGGILADDMGLGKTIQCLTFLDRLISNQKKDHLILIAGPLASISVWKKESEKFFQNLEVMVWHGADRNKTVLPKRGIILTTYGTLSRDFEEWKNKISFDIAILDEAQNLKNYRSLNSHAVRQTKSNVYFCLTGTPIENNLLDLWSLFDIFFPGYLGKKDGFQKSFSDSNRNNHKLLKEKVEPFILRRTKENVLTELPSRTEIFVPVAMTEEQRKFYEEARKRAAIELANAGRDYLMKLLPHLTRLRRIACHPEIGNPMKTDPLLSGKFQHLQEVLDGTISSSSGILIFSQFADVLKICGRMLDKMGHEYHYLDGSTKMTEREKLVANFQNGSKHIFLISLKAGGTALTLHRADTVMHLDPWWNPAVERQASDRAHRIGQKRKVFVYKIYSEDSIEEKVLELQKKKKEIFDSIFEGNFEISSRITRLELQELLER